MKRYALVLLTACVGPFVMAQAPPPAQNIYVPADGRCADVHPGDKVHYSLTIDWAGNPRAVYGDLRLRPAGELRGFGGLGLPPADFRSLGGGGVGTHDPAQANVFHFVFTVPDEIYGGVYRGAGVSVQMAEQDPSSPLHEIDVTRHTRKQVRAYCLNVISSYGAQPNRPVVTDFQPGDIEPKQ